MKQLVRRAGIAALVAVVGLVVAGTSASAAVEPSSTATPTAYACLDQEDSYGAPGVCQLVVVQAEATCIKDAPYLVYSLRAEGTPNTTATIVWGDPDGQHYTMSDLPLSGQVLWPGAAVDSQGNATDWPGWTLGSDGVTWSQGDEWSWVRPTVPVTFEVNPTAQVAAAYPAESMPCSDPPVTVVSAAGGSVPAGPAGSTTVVLSATGSESTPLLLTAAGLLLVGSLVLGVRAAMRRRATAH